MFRSRAAKRLLATGCVSGVGLAVLLGALIGGDPAAKTAADVEGRGVEFRDGRLSVDGADLHYVIGGKGPPVMLVAGFPQTWYAWRKVMPALARRHTVVAVDPPGIGGSDVRASGYDADSVAASLHGLAQRLRLGRVSLVGHDLGGWFAYAYARRYRQGVNRLAILEAGLPGLGLERRLDFSEEGRGGLSHVVFFMKRSTPEALLEGRERDFISRFLGRQRGGTFSGGAVDEYVRAYSGRERLTAALEQYRAFYEDAAQNRRGRQPLLEAPVLALGGSRGVGRLPFLNARRAARRVRGGVVPEAGHWLMEERPVELTRRLLEFLPRR
jgi:pimeloyl-ACP methyl ester carboxylesterase